MNKIVKLTTRGKSEIKIITNPLNYTKDYLLALAQILM